jgi:hypothetical protein
MNYNHKKYGIDVLSVQSGEIITINFNLFNILKRKKIIWFNSYYNMNILRRDYKFIKIQKKYKIKKIKNYMWNKII